MRGWTGITEHNMDELIQKIICWNDKKKNAISKVLVFLGYFNKLLSLGRFKSFSIFGSTTNNALLIGYY